MQSGESDAYRIKRCPKYRNIILLGLGFVVKATDIRKIRKGSQATESTANHYIYIVAAANWALVNIKTCYWRKDDVAGRCADDN